jgi:8-oxo-dGTP pyrophosphatase MutT (NUDIX family)
MSDKHLQAKIGQYALITNSANRLLLLQRQKSKTWCLPGGRLNENEEWDESLLRELYVELNLACLNPKPFRVNILKDAHRVEYCIYFTVDSPDASDIRLNDEHSDFKWISLEELKKFDVEDEKIRDVVNNYLLRLSV